MRTQISLKKRYKIEVASGTHVRRDPYGSILGILVFLGGVALLLVVFRLAYAMFSVPPKNALGLQSGKTMDFGVVGNSLSEIVIRILLLLVMGVCGSLIANRGISLYTGSRAIQLKHDQPETAP